jgi:hypothetical protein
MIVNRHNHANLRRQRHNFLRVPSQIMLLQQLKLRTAPPTYGFSSAWICSAWGTSLPRKPAVRQTELAGIPVSAAVAGYRLLPLCMFFIRMQSLALLRQNQGRDIPTSPNTQRVPAPLSRGCSLAVLTTTHPAAGATLRK